MNKINEDSQILKEIYDAFGPFAVNYKVDFRRFLEDIRLMRQLARSGARILDIGCGPGFLVAAANKMGMAASGVDKYISPDQQNTYFNVAEMDQLERVWKMFEMEICFSDYKDLETKFDQGCFDIIISDAFIEHLMESPRFLFRIIYNLLKPGGYLILSTPNLASVLKRIRFLLGMSCMWDFEDYWSAGLFLGHRREFTIAEIEKMCEKSDFEVIRLYTKNIFSSGAVRKIGPLRKVARLLCYAASYIIPDSGDTIYLVARKPAN